MTRMIAPMVLYGPISGYRFEACVTKILAQELLLGDLATMGNPV